MSPFLPTYPLPPIREMPQEMETGRRDQWSPLFIEGTCPKRSQNECPLFLEARRHEFPDVPGHHIQAREQSLGRRSGAPAPPQDKLPPRVANGLPTPTPAFLGLTLGGRGTDGLFLGA